jgi:hypothetical protein
MAPGFDNGFWGFGVAILDALGQAVDWVSESVAGMSVGSDGVQVSLTWNKPADMDLSVTDPNGLWIDFEQRLAGSGALDLDSNALCVIDNKNAENISWQPGKEPTGIYQVRVNLYDGCGQDLITWRLTARFCGKTETYTGTVLATDADKSGEGEVVTQFTVDCTQVVQGTVIREKIFDVSKPGIRELDFVPYAPIRVKTASGITTLAQGVTDNKGKYDLRFGNLDQGDYYLEVEASWVDPTTNEVRARVGEQSGSQAYRAQSEVISGAGEMVQTVNPRIHVEDKSGAFNILHGIRNGYSWVTKNASITKATSLGPLWGRWEMGKKSPGTDADAEGGSYQWQDAVFVNGFASMPTEWSDSAISHEFMHYVVSQLSFSPLPGGPHHIDKQIPPRLAFSEGLATAFGQDALGSSMYYNVTPNFSWNRDLEPGPGPASRGTLDDPNTPVNETGLHTGMVNEMAVGAILWDLLDPANEAYDKVQERQFTLAAVFEHLQGLTYTDRDNNGIELVDFVDALRTWCPTNIDSSLKCITEEFKFPYDYPAGVACK